MESNLDCESNSVADFVCSDFRDLFALLKELIVENSSSLSELNKSKDNNNVREFPVTKVVAIKNESYDPQVVEWTMAEIIRT